MLCGLEGIRGGAEAGSCRQEMPQGYGVSHMNPHAGTTSLRGGDRAAQAGHRRVLAERTGHCLQGSCHSSQEMTGSLHQTRALSLSPKCSDITKPC